MTTNLIFITNIVTNTVNIPVEVTNAVVTVAQLPAKIWWQDFTFWGTVATGLGALFTLVSAILMRRSVEEMKKQRTFSQIQEELNYIKKYYESKWSGDLYTKIYTKNSFNNMDIYSFAVEFTIQNDESRKLLEHLVRFEVFLKQYDAKKIKLLNKIKQYWENSLFLLCDFTFLFTFPLDPSLFDNICKQHEISDAKHELKNLCTVLYNSYICYELLFFEQIPQLQNTLGKSEQTYSKFKNTTFKQFETLLKKAPIEKTRLAELAEETTT